MRYEIETTKLTDTLFEIHAIVFDEGDEVVIAGVTKVNVPMKMVGEGETQEDIARRYAEEIFMPDLRRNDDRLENLVLSFELAPPEEEPEAGE